MLNFIRSIFTDRTFGQARSSGWSKVRAEHIRQQPECQVCGKKGLIVNNPVHHIQPFWKYRERELEKSNLITLCSLHHLEWGHLFSFKSYNLEIKEWILAIKNKP